jgi:hypothetical protein
MSEKSDWKIKNSKIKTRKIKDRKIKDRKIKDQKIKDRKIKNRKIKNRKSKTQKSKTQKSKTEKSNTEKSKPENQRPKNQRPKNQIPKNQNPNSIFIAIVFYDVAVVGVIEISARNIPWRTPHHIIVYMWISVLHLNIYKVLMNNLGLVPDVYFLRFVYQKEYKVRKL